MPDRDASFLSGGAGSGSGLEEGGGAGGGGGAVGGGGGVIMGGGGALGNGGGAGCGNGGSGLALDGVCRDYVRNVCKRGKRCRFRHPDVNSVPDLGVQKNEFVFCHDHQNKECMRSSCRFVHGSKEDEDHYKKTGELPQRLRGRVAARLGLSPTDLPHSRGEVPICRDFLKGECQRGNKCKFRHVQKDYEYETTHHHPALGGGAMGGNTLLGGGGAMGGPGGGGGGGGPNGAGGMMGGLNCGGGLLGGVNGGSCGGMVGLVGGGGGTVMGMGGTIPIRDPPGGMSGGLGGGGGGMGGCLSALGSMGQRRYDRGGAAGAGGGPWGEPLFDGSGAGLFEAGGGGGGPLEAVDPHHLTLQLKRRRMEALGHYELQTPTSNPTLQPHAASRPLMEFRFLEEENSLLRRRVEELKKQVSNLMATNEVLLEQNAQFRSQAKVMTLTSTPAPGSEQSLVPGPPMVAAVSSYNHGIAQTHTTLSSAPQRGPVTQQELVVVASTESNAPAPLNPEISCPLSAALVQTMGMGAPAVVSMAPVAVSVAPVVSVSMAQAMPGITMSHAPSQAMPGITMSHAPTTPMVSYPIASQSMRITSLPH